MTKYDSVSIQSHDLRSKISSGELVIGIIGLGYVGLPLSLAFANSGVSTVGFDIDQSKVDSINESASFFSHISSDDIKQARLSGKLSASSDFSLIPDVDAIIICVPTPLNKYREPDLSYIESTLETLSPHLRKGQLLSLESTTYPGTTDEVVAPYLVRKGFTVGKDIFLVYSPEREDPGNKKFSPSSIPKVIGGYTKECCELGDLLYSLAIDKTVLVSSARAAELTKLLENIHRAVNIGLMNEIKPLAAKLGIDLYEVIKAASTKPFWFCTLFSWSGNWRPLHPHRPFLSHLEG